MKNVYLILGLFLCSVSCTSNADLDVKKSNENIDSLESNVDKKVSNNTDSLVLLAKNNWTEIKASSYDIIDTLLHKKVNIGSVREVDVWYTNKGIVVDFGDENGLFTGAKLLPTPYVNEFNLQVTGEMKNLIGSEDSDEELVLWWNTMDGVNGMEEGHEMELNGLFIIDLDNMELVQDIIYVDHHLSYSGNPTDADLKNVDYHAKIADNTDFEICSFATKIKLDLNQILISDFYLQKEGKAQCEFTDVTGSYSFNSEKKSYQKMLK